MFELNTKRLKIIPLELKYFKMLLENVEETEKMLNLSISGEKMESYVKEAMESLYKKALENQENYIWFTNWQIILKEENISIGSACFKNNPNLFGEVEIGYGINEKYRNKGFMTEAVKKMCEWAFEQPNVLSVIAETELTNIASHKVLQKAGMSVYLNTNDALWWKITKQE